MDTTGRDTAGRGPAGQGTTTSKGLVAAAWAVVGLPLAWGVFSTFTKAIALFR